MLWLSVRRVYDMSFYRRKNDAYDQHVDIVASSVEVARTSIQY